MFDDPKFLDKLDGIVKRADELQNLLGTPEIINNRAEYLRLSRENAAVSQLAEAITRRKKLAADLEGALGLAREGDAEMREMAKDEIARLEAERDAVEQKIKILLLPKDPVDEKNILLEVRAGTGGDEAALFAGDLYRMYMRYAERHRWRVEIMSRSDGASGGIKEAIALIEGDDVYSKLKYESGVHRVQRVPATEAQGRIHTSAATVVVLPEAEEIDVRIEDKDLRIDVMRAGGPGGQSVNTTDSAVRLTHIPTGLIVVCMDEKSQHKNKAKAMKILRSRLMDAELERQQAERTAERRAMVRSGDRSEKIRTYNFPQDRVTDHRLERNFHNLPAFMNGEIDDLVQALRMRHQTELLEGGVTKS